MDTLDVWYGDVLSARLEYRDGLFFLMPVTGDVDLSLAMPFSGYDPLIGWQVLPPVISQNMPEGALLHYIENTLRKYSDKHWDNTMEVLSHTGGNQIGLIRLTLPGKKPDYQHHEQSASNAILHSSDHQHVLLDCLEKYAFKSGVSGMQIKTLVEDRARVTLPFDKQIVKFDSPEYPGLMVNEYFCLRAASLSGLNTVDAFLSDDGKRLLIDRFDVTDKGEQLGFEEACTLQGKPSQGKYSGDYLSAFATLLKHVSPKAMHQTRQDLFASTVLMTVLGNGDAHLKNFGVLYDKDKTEINLAPFYDMVCTTAYIPKDLPALGLPDIGKAWPDKDSLIELGLLMNLKKGHIEKAICSVSDGVTNAIHEAKTYAKNNPEYNQLIDKMTETWQENLAKLLLNTDCSPKT